VNEGKRIRPNNTTSQKHEAANSVDCAAASLVGARLTYLIRFRVRVLVRIGLRSSRNPTVVELLDIERAAYPPSDETIKVTDNAPDKTRFSAMAKRLATDNGSAVVDRALQLFGGYGYLQDYPIERFWRDLRVHSILEGTNQIMRMVVGRDLQRQ